MDLLISDKACNKEGRLCPQQTGLLMYLPAKPYPAAGPGLHLTCGSMELQDDYQNICHPTFPVELT